MHIGFVGGGVMGEAMLRGILNKGIALSADITVSDVNAERCHYLKQKYDVIIALNNIETVRKSDVVILAIKPQTMPDLEAQLKGKLSDKQLVLSILAGVTLNTLMQKLGHELVVRVMPNTPAQIGEGISVWTTSKTVNREQMETARNILSTLGKEIYVGDEKYLDMATAVSGSGPAYVMLMMESFLDAAVHIGIPRDMARTLVLQTFSGTTKMVQESDKHIAELRNMVTSPGGTTAEGLLKMEEGSIRALISGAVVAGFEKAKALGKG